MKLTKLTLAAAAALGFCALQASADPIGTTAFSSKLNVSITVYTNKPTTFSDSGTTSHSAVGSAKAGNKQLLDLFAHWEGADRTSEPWKSAKLVIGWDWDYDVLVVDKTGTNVLADVTNTGDDTWYFLVDFFDEYGVGDVTEKDADPGFYDVVDTDSSDFYLVDEDFYLPYTYLWSYGGNKQNFHQAWDASDIATKWSDMEKATFPFTGDQDFLGTETTDITTKATISASGSGKGQNYIGWAD